jgi:hypothetical protein
MYSREEEKRWPEIEENQVTFINNGGMQVDAHWSTKLLIMPFAKRLPRQSESLFR